MPAEPLPPEARAADTDRVRTVEQLKAALDEGRIDLSEYDERAQAAYNAKTYGELDELLTDIPGATAISRSVVATPSRGVESLTHARRRGKRKELRKAWSAYGGGVIFFTGLWGIGWIASGQLPNFWPIWILGIWGIVVLCQTWNAFTRD